MLQGRGRNFSEENTNFSLSESSKYKRSILEVPDTEISKLDTKINILNNLDVSWIK